jgi:hypothetical protein
MSELTGAKERKNVKNEECEHLRLNRVLGAYRCAKCGASFKVKKVSNSKDD